MTSTPCKLDLLSLPPEILDEIVTEIPSRNTLLALSKSSRSLAALIIPHHLNFCVIRARIFRSHLWERLARDGLHAANVRSMTVLKNNFEDAEEAGWPVARTQAASVAEIETTLVSALQRMVHLNEFAWYHVCPPALTGEDDIWSTLQRLGTVRNLDILDMPDGTNSDRLKKGIIFSDSFLRLSGFTTLKLHSSPLGLLGGKLDLTPLIDMLEHNCPDLESLSLSLYLQNCTASVSHLLSHVSWPRLHTLRMTGCLGCSSASLAQFLRAHPGIEELALGHMLPGRSWKEFGQVLRGTEDGREEKPILPCLKTLQCSSAQAFVLLMRPIETLETLLGVDVQDTIMLHCYFDWDDEWVEEYGEDPAEDDRLPILSPWKIQFLARLWACPSIRHLSVIHQSHTRQLDILVTVTPHLTRLGVTRAWGLSYDIDEWCALYTLFPCLQTIAAGHLFHLGPPHFQDKIQNNDNIQRLARACPRLKVLVDRDWKAIITSREEGKDGGNMRWVIEKLNESEEGKVEGEVIYGF
ncbi:hypothetical protein EW146_g10289 [Bondarzewia mesenterica]|uniref:F-box domain-containing protein n=1 Tax=Bondarzewia mesenterica TaxID=1095465 RepID=A0A4S4KYN5_9AGAM|nr:hypothetical protein EW146_g10289 [Bondarzewia mesenterica]